MNLHKNDRIQETGGILSSICALVARSGLAYCLLVLCSLPAPCHAIGNSAGPPGSTSFEPSASLEESDPAPAGGIKGIVDSSWFVLVTGVASIIGLLLTLYGTEVKPLPQSMYRTLTWRRVLLLSAGVGLVVLAATGFYNREPPTLLYELRQGINSVRIDVKAVAWIGLALVGMSLGVFGYRLDPLKQVQQKLREERRALQRSRQMEIARLLHTTSFEELSEPQKIIYADLMQYYAAMQVRILDVLLGPSLPGPSDSYRRTLFELSLQGASLMQDAAMGVRSRGQADEAGRIPPESQESFLSILVRALLADSEIQKSSDPVQDGSAVEPLPEAVPDNTAEARDSRAKVIPRAKPQRSRSIKRPKRKRSH